MPIYIDVNRYGTVYYEVIKSPVKSWRLSENIQDSQPRNLASGRAGF